MDGFSLKNFGALALAGATSLPFSSLSCSPLLPCTPAAVLELLGRVGGVEGKRVVMVGKSMVVGMPLMLGLLNANATGYPFIIIVIFIHIIYLLSYPLSKYIFSLSIPNLISFPFPTLSPNSDSMPYKNLQY